MLDLAMHVLNQKTQISLYLDSSLNTIWISHSETGELHECLGRLKLYSWCKSMQKESVCSFKGISLRMFNNARRYNNKGRQRWGPCLVSHTEL